MENSNKVRGADKGRFRKISQLSKKILIQQVPGYFTKLESHQDPELDGARSSEALEELQSQLLNYHRNKDISWHAF